MRNPKEQSKRWLKQSEYDLSEAKEKLNGKSFAYACFYSEQSAQKAIKAFLIYNGKRFITIHSVGELLKEASLINNLFAPLVEAGKTLDRYYLSSRYPDALPEPAIPYESFTFSEMKEAVSIAQKIFDACKKAIVE